MRETNVESLLKYLFDQLDVLSTVDLTDDSRVDGACAVNKAVNDTARSIVNIAELSLRAYDARPGACSPAVVRGFFEKGE